jgi:NAD+ diphosphatase
VHEPRERFWSRLAPPAGESDADALWFLFRGRELLVTLDGGVLAGPDPAAAGTPPLRRQFLGLLGGRACWSGELREDAAPPPGMAFRDLRFLYGRLPPELHELAGRAVQIMEWDRSHQFCGACGAPTRLAAEERARVCERCGLAHYPRLAPSMIVAVERDDALLLARAPHFPRGIYSVLAGFVEPGESVEQTVAREVWEETGVEVEAIRYFASQPWPYPNSLMLGFQARWRAGEIRVDGREIEDAGWFRADAMPPLFPGNVSISQWLIGDFLARHGAAPQGWRRPA